MFRLAVISTLLLCGLTAGLAQKTEDKVAARKTAPDGITEGWFLEQPDPEPGQQWRLIDSELVIARRGRVIQRFYATATYWSWAFWSGSEEVALQEGFTHGVTTCVLMDVRTGKQISEVENCNDGKSERPAWARAVLAAQQVRSTTQAANRRSPTARHSAG